MKPDLKVVVELKSISAPHRAERDQLLGVTLGPIVEREDPAPASPIIIADKNPVFRVVFIVEFPPPKTKIDIGVALLAKIDGESQGYSGIKSAVITIV